MKKLMIFVLVTALCLGSIGCGKQTNSTDKEKSTVHNENKDNEKTTKEIVETTTEKSTEEDKEKMCLDALTNMEVELLSYTHVTEQEAKLRSDYGGATLLTIGVKCNEKEGKYLKKLEIVGDCTKTADGKTVYQGYDDAVWGNKDATYYLFVVTIGGHIDVNTITIDLSGTAKGTKMNKSLVNNIGKFDTVVEAFKGYEDTYGCDSRVVKLKNHYYIIATNECSSSGTGYEGSEYTEEYQYETITNNIILVPLDCGANGDLVNDDLEIINNSGNEIVEVLSGTKADHKESSSCAEIQDVIKIQAKVFLRDLTNNEDHDDLMKEVLKQCKIEIPDGDGNKVSLYVWR